jgi:endoglucanase
MRPHASAPRRSTLAAGLVLAAALTAALTVPASAATDAFVRVNQVGYPASSAKRAYLMSGVAETGATFAVRNGAGATVFSAPIGQSLGSWSTAYPFVYALDFGAVTTSGTYTIAVSGPAAASSPTFAIGTGQAVYQQALNNALFFFQTERDGPGYVPNALRTAPAHVNDQHAMTYVRPHVSPSGRFSGDLTPLGVRIDASGGWWDAGDYIKGVQTLSYTADMLLVGVRDFPSLMGAGSATSNFIAEAKFGADWLLRMWDDTNGIFYFQVGIGTGNAKTVGDHDLWRLPQADDTFGGTDPAYRYIRNRPVFASGPAGTRISPNLAGRSAAALALCFQIYKTSDPAFANSCLRAAQHIFDLADTTPKGNLLTYLPFSFYPETEWRSDLEFAAVELYLAVKGGGLPSALPHTDATFYLQQAAHWAHEYIVGPDDAADTLNLYDVSGLAHYELHRAIDQAPAPLPALEVTKADLVADIKKALDNAIARAATDPFQFGFPWATWDTASHGTGLAVMAAEYAQLTGSSAHAGWGGRWLGNILGANAWGSSFIVGDGTTFPHCIHHQVANLVGNLDGTPPILKGAVVEGPNGTLYTGFQTGMRNCPPDDSDPFAVFNSSKARFKDDIESFSTVEPAVDLSATSPLAFAWQTVPVPPPPPGPGGPQTVVTIQFDDGVADQYGSLAALRSHGMHATYYVNSAVIGDQAHLTWAQLQELAGAGNEIAGHTLHHVNLKPLKEADARQEVCGDRVALWDQGLRPTSFAYPFGGYDAGTQAVIAACGYNSGRGVSGVNGTSVFAETIPPADAYATRTPPNPKQGTTLATIEGYVTDAAAHGGGWVQLVFHHLCDGCDAYSITPADFDGLVDWLDDPAQVASGVVVKTTHEVIGGAVQPRIPP